jgi:hypothetical protein
VLKKGKIVSPVQCHSCAERGKTIEVCLCGKHVSFDDCAISLESKMVTSTMSLPTADFEAAYVRVSNNTKYVYLHTHEIVETL